MNQANRTYKIDAFILTDYFYEIIASRYGIDIENEKFTIEYEVTEEEDIYSFQYYDNIEILNVMYNSQAIDLPGGEVAKIEQDLYDEMYENYYNAQNKLKTQKNAKNGKVKIQSSNGIASTD